MDITGDSNGSRNRAGASERSSRDLHRPRAGRGACRIGCQQSACQHGSETGISVSAVQCEAAVPGLRQGATYTTATAAIMNYPGKSRAQVVSADL